MHTVDIEEERDHVDQHGLVVGDLAHGVSDLGEHTAHDVADGVLGTALATVLLLIGANERQGKDEPPGTSDDKRQTRCQHGRDAKSGATHDERQADDERHGGTDVAPGIARAGHGVHALVGGNVGQHGVVERHRRVKADGAQHVHGQKCHGGHWDSLRQAKHQAREEEAQEELDLVAGVVGKRAQNGHEHGDDQRGDRLCIAPGDHQVGRRSAGIDSVKVNGHHRGIEQHEGRIAHIIHNPVTLELGVFHGQGPFVFARYAVSSSYPNCPEPPVRIRQRGTHGPYSSRSNSSSALSTRPL